MGRQAPWRIVATSPGAGREIAAATVAAARDFATFVAAPCQTNDGIIGGNEPTTRRILAESMRVKVISRPTVGYDQIAVVAATEAGIAVAHVPDSSTHRPSCWPSIGAASMRADRTQGRPYGTSDRRPSARGRHQGQCAAA